MKTAKNTSRLKLQIAIVIGATLVLLVAIGGWVYIQRQELAQRDKEFRQEQEAKWQEQEEEFKRLKYQECEERQRHTLETTGIPIGINCELGL